MKIEYHGAPFAGWQRQKDVPSVQAAVEDALRKLEADHAGIAAAGRTDAGVHAKSQVATFVRERDDIGPPDEKLLLALNSRLRASALRRGLDLPLSGTGPSVRGQGEPSDALVSHQLDCLVDEGVEDDVLLDDLYPGVADHLLEGPDDRPGAEGLTEVQPLVGG